MPAVPAVPATSTTGPAQVLQTGTYWISSAAYDRYFISRPQAEDRSLLPKPVLTLPKEFAEAWEINRLADGTYTMKNRGSYVVEIKDQLFAQLVEQGPKLQTRWRITSVNWQGEDQFIIENVERTEGWNLRMTPGGSAIPFVQPEIVPLISTRSLPPQYTSNERFIIKRKTA
ncbi:hypothetical protein ABW20_dc0100809 [Dactylellina cionopaga]|nr:hypothetical protein ABW20_dc0100809 [Dactylellina cionopaga]